MQTHAKVQVTMTILLHAVNSTKGKTNQPSNSNQLEGARKQWQMYRESIVSINWLHSFSEWSGQVSCLFKSSVFPSQKLQGRERRIETHGQLSIKYNFYSNNNEKWRSSLPVTEEDVYWTLSMAPLLVRCLLVLSCVSRYSIQHMNVIVYWLDWVIDALWLIFWWEGEEKKRAWSMVMWCDVDDD